MQNAIPGKNLHYVSLSFLNMKRIKCLCVQIKMKMGRSKQRLFILVRPPEYLQRENQEKVGGFAADGG